MDSDNSVAYMLPPTLPRARWDSDARACWMEDDLKAARELQMLLLPNQAAGAEGLAIAAGFRPAHGVSGDIYDRFECSDGRVVLIVGDACGKGAAAALYGGMVSGLLRTLVARRRRPTRLLQALNQALLERRIHGQCVSLLALSWQASSRRLMLASGGALPPIICRQGQILEVDVGGVPLGLWENWEFEEASLQMEPHDVVVLFSDGITEQQNAAGESYDSWRVVEVLQSSWHRSPQSIVNAIFGDLNQFAGDETSDDQTLVVFKVI